MPRDTYERKRKTVELPPSGVYTGRRSIVKNGYQADANGAYEIGADGAYEIGADGVAGKVVASRENDGVKYEPSFNGALAAAKSKPAAVPAVSGAAPAVSGAAPAISGAAVINKAADSAAGKLADVLEREALLYRDAAAISTRKTEIIVHGKIEELDCLVKAEQAIIIKIGKLENEREIAVSALSGELNLDLENATLSDINSRLGEDSFARLSDCQKSLADTIGGLKNSNDMNAQLIQNALDYVNFSVNILTTDQNSGNTYSQDGDEGVGLQRRNIFDVKL